MLQEFTIQSSRLADPRRIFRPWLIFVRESGLWIYTKAHVECECSLTRCVHNHYPIIKRIEWDEITGVRSAEGILWSDILIHTLDGSEYCVKGLWRWDAGKFIRDITEHLFEITHNQPRQLDSLLRNNNHTSEPLDCCELMNKNPSNVKIIYQKTK
ncbi:MAG TPA: hypothetical protein PK878_13815 [bacterium]|nr:hypothetical protein [Candidatus Omnitrophota bacterium]HOJ61356.1 hypothetical protein [bacterium]HOL95204.1 hypothetical protein [bacterium]HPP01626.1 hypothetical protein [bacterium]HXK92559.1 hypothetical protein [bacterium]